MKKIIFKINIFIFIYFCFITSKSWSLAMQSSIIEKKYNQEIKTKNLEELIKSIKYSLYFDNIPNLPKTKMPKLISYDGKNFEEVVKKIQKNKKDLEEDVNFRESMEYRLKIAQFLKKKYKVTNEYKNFIDLHHHSFYSDGVCSPAFIVFDAWRKGLKTISITDHITFEHIEEAVRAGEIFGIQVIPGIEIDVSMIHPDAKSSTENSHVVVYFPYGKGIKGRENQEELFKWLKSIKDKLIPEQCNMLSMFDSIKTEIIRQRFNESKFASEFNVEITEQDLLKYIGKYPFRWGGFLSVILKQKYPDKFYDSDNKVKFKDCGFKEIFNLVKGLDKNIITRQTSRIVNIAERYNKIFNKEGKKINLSKGIPLEKVLQFAQEENGVVVFAHPFEPRNFIKLFKRQIFKLDKLLKENNKFDYSKKDSELNDEEKAFKDTFTKAISKIKELIRKYNNIYGGFDGIEVYIGKINSKSARIELEKMIKELEKEGINLIMTISTDSHNFAEYDLGIGIINNQNSKGSLFDVQEELLKNNIQSKIIKSIMDKAIKKSS